MRVLLVYYSFTGQAERVSARISNLLREKGHGVTPCRISFSDSAEPVEAPVSFSVIGKWGSNAKKRVDAPISITPPDALDADYDLIILLTNTWSFTTSVPIQSFLRGPGASRLRGKRVAIGVVCRGFWKGNLALTTKLVEDAKGRVVTSEVFAHAGSWLQSTITNVYGMTRPYPLPTRFGLLRLPPFGVSPESMEKIPAFVTRALAAVNR